MTKKSICTTDIIAGKPLLWDIYDQQGRLVLKQGMVIQNDKQVARLVAMALYCNDEEPEVPDDNLSIYDVLSPFDRIASVIYDLESLLEKILYQSIANKDAIEQKILTLVDELIDLSEYDTDAVLGAIHIDHHHRYSVLHPLHMALLCFLLGRRVKFDESTLRSTMAAALTSNLGMVELQDELHHYREPLDNKQRKLIDLHPMRSVVLLKRAGIRDKFWMEAVLQHHERQDGSGYPRQLKNDRFVTAARLIGLTDRYHAMVSPRAYRDGLSPTEALRRLFKNRGKEVDEVLGLMLIKEVGIYPPGTHVKLRSGETAIITRRASSDRMQPKAKAIGDLHNVFYARPVERDTNTSDYQILGMCAPMQMNHQLLLLWDYNI